MNTTQTQRVDELVQSIGQQPDIISDMGMFVAFPTVDVDEATEIIHGHNYYVWQEGRWEGFWSRD